MNKSLPLEQLLALIQNSANDQLPNFLSVMWPSEASHLISRLEEDQRVRLFELLPKDIGAALLKSLPLALASEVLQGLDPKRAAALLDLLPSDDQTDLVTSLDKIYASRVLAEMAPAEAEDVNRLSGFAPNTAGGLMATEFLAYPITTTIRGLMTDLKARADEYVQYPAQYVYVISNAARLVGVIRLRDLPFRSDDDLLGDLSLQTAITVRANAELDDLKDFFQRHKFVAAPVVDDNQRLLGVVTRQEFDEAVAEQAARTLLRVSGIVFGEEFRSMPLLTRVGGRLAWLAVTMLLSILAASVVGLFQDTLSQFIALAVFLPVISGMSGNAGNQAIAVSMRELSVGLVKPQEIRWVLMKEAGVALISGVSLGLAMVTVAVVWKNDSGLGLIVGSAQALSILLAACLGGIVPLLLKRLGFDPAIASAPLLTTITDAAGFFLVLGFASLWLAP